MKVKKNELKPSKIFLYRLALPHWEESLNNHNDCDRFEHWTLTNKMLTEKCKSLPLGKNNELHRYKISGTWLRSNICEKDLRIFLLGCCRESRRREHYVEFLNKRQTINLINS